MYEAIYLNRMKPAVRPLLLLITTSALAAGNGEDLRRDKAGSDYEENVRIAARYPVADLKKAIDEGDANTLKRLLDQGVPSSCPLPWSKDQWEGYPPPTDYPIHLAAASGHLEIVRLLLDRGVDIEARSADEDGQTTALDTAAFWGKTDTVTFLLARGAKPTQRTMKNARRFDDNSIGIVRMLHQHGVTVSADMFLDHPQTCDSLLPFLSQETKDELLKHSARHIAEAASSPYHREAEGSLGTIRALVALGAKTDQPWEGLLPLHHAVFSGKEMVVGYFLSTGQPIDAKGTLRDNDSEPPIVITGIQPIHIALGSPEIIPYLINKGAQIDARTGEGWQPIHLAAAYGEKATLEAVIHAGGDPSAKTRDGKTPLQVAEKFGKKENADFLKHPNDGDSRPKSPPHRR
jgi:ankyrin repeat protein